MRSILRIAIVLAALIPGVLGVLVTETAVQPLMAQEAIGSCEGHQTAGYCCDCWIGPGWFGIGTRRHCSMAEYGGTWVLECNMDPEDWCPSNPDWNCYL